MVQIKFQSTVQFPYTVLTPTYFPVPDAVKKKFARAGAPSPDPGSWGSEDTSPEFEEQHQVKPYKFVSLLIRNYPTSDTNCVSGEYLSIDKNSCRR